MSLGEIMSELRKDKGMKQKELAALIGVSPSSVSDYETNNSEPDIENIKRIAEIFDVSVDYLLGVVRNNLNYKTLETIFVSKENKSILFGDLLKRISKLSPSTRLNLLEYLEFLEYKNKK